LLALFYGLDVERILPTGPVPGGWSPKAPAHATLDRSPRSA